MLRLWLGGRIEGEFQGEPLAMPGGDRARALIGRLALHPVAHPRNELAARLWPDTPEANARANLRTAIWSIRQSWGPVADLVLDVSRTTVGLRPDVLWVDVVAGLDESGGLGGLDGLDGELLPGIDDDWVHTERARLAERRSDALAGEAAEAEAEGRFEDAVRWARRRCALAPLDEAAHRDLLRRLDQAGDRPGAVLASRTFSDRLWAELGVRPSPATRAVLSGLEPAGVTSSHCGGRTVRACPRDVDADDRVESGGRRRRPGCGSHR